MSCLGLILIAINLIGFLISPSIADDAISEPSPPPANSTFDETIDKVLDQLRAETPNLNLIPMPINKTINYTEVGVVLTPIEIVNCSIKNIDSMFRNNSATGKEDGDLMKNITGKITILPMFITCKVNFTFQLPDKPKRFAGWTMNGTASRPNYFTYDFNYAKETKKLTVNTFKLSPWPQFVFALNFQTSLHDVGLFVLKDLPTFVAKQMQNFLRQYIRHIFENSDDPKNAPELIVSTTLPSVTNSTESVTKSSSVRITTAMEDVTTETSTKAMSKSGSKKTTTNDKDVTTEEVTTTEKAVTKSVYKSGSKKTTTDDDDVTTEEMTTTEKPVTKSDAKKVTKVDTKKVTEAMTTTESTTELEDDVTTEEVVTKSDAKKVTKADVKKVTTDGTTKVITESTREPEDDVTTVEGVTTTIRATKAITKSGSKKTTTDDEDVTTEDVTKSDVQKVTKADANKVTTVATTKVTTGSVTEAEDDSTDDMVEGSSDEATTTVEPNDR